jgi:predicted nucleic acid-binding protein
VTAYVLDASVAAKWFLPQRDEPLSSEAVHILKRFASGQLHLSVPDLFWPELGNILGKSVQSGRISEVSAHEAIESLAELNIPTTPTRLLISDALLIAVNSRRTVYDSVYVALAVASGQALVTADERLANALAARFPIRWLGSIA